MKNLKLFTKLFLSHTTLSLFVIVVLSFIFYTLLRDTLIQRTIDQLSSINILKKDLVENYFVRSREDLHALQVENKFLELYNIVSGRPKQAAADLLEIDSLISAYDFKDLYIINADQHQLFSLTKKILPTRLVHKIDSITGPHKNQLQVIDASPYSSEKQTLLYYYIPVSKNQKRVGTVLIQENFQKIQKILLENIGMGKTGESYMVGDDFYLRSASRFSPQTPPLAIKAETEAVRNAFQNKENENVVTDYRNVNVLSVYSELEKPNVRWIIFSEIDLEEAMLPIIRLRNYIIGITLIIAVLILLITYLLSNLIARPIQELKGVIILLSKGIIPADRSAITTTDEIGQIATAIHQLTEGLKRTTAFANEIGSGNFNTAFTTLSDKDTLGFALIHMRDELQRFNDKELKQSRERATALLEGQENERKRIIQELHDGVGQLLTAVRMRVEMLEEEGELKNEIKAQINEIIAEVKRISYNVMPHALVDYGLEAALKGLCDTVVKYATFTIDFRYVREVERKLNFEISIAVFRIVQEGLNNIIKHANASHVTLHLLDKEDEIYFILEDNGKGFTDTDSTKNRGYGLQNMKERAALLNGTALIHSVPDQGTVIEVHISIESN
jgi:signal transduction histidine kinase